VTKDRTEYFKEYHKKYYEKNRTHSILRTKKYYQVNREKILKRHKDVRDFVAKYKSERGCQRCGYNEHYTALDLHHVNGTKEVNLSEAHSMKRVQREIGKCIVLCANCHRIVHHEMKVVNEDKEKWYNQLGTGVTMLEKSGSLLLTKEDLEDFSLGKVSKRVSDTWGLSFEELKEYIDNNNYEVITNG
jgi:hypothetical protein